MSLSIKHSSGFKKKLLTLALLIAMPGCSLLSGHDSSLHPDEFGSLSQNTEWYQGQLSASDTQYTFGWQILLARSYAAAGDSNNAFEVISQMRENAVTPLQGNEADIIEAQVRASSGRLQEAAHLLEAVDTMNLPAAVAAYYYNLYGNIQNQLKKPIDAGLAFLRLADNVNDSNKNTAWKKALNSFLSADKSSLYQSIKKASTDQDRGFIEYALIQKTGNQETRTRLMNSFNTKYPDHPVLTLNNAAVTSTATSQSAATAPQKNNSTGSTIAVFLPLSGQYARMVGDPVKLGITNAYNDRGIQMNIKFYDTESQDIATLYNSALRDGADMIIGPIIKNEVDQLIAQNPSIPVIALNQGEISKKANVYYLTLAPEIDTESAVTEMGKNGIKSPMVIVPENTYGSRISKAFNNYWNKSYGGNPDTCYFTDINSLQNTLHGCFTGSSSSFDAAYIVGSANEASTIREYISMNGDRIPVYYVGAKSNSGILNSSALRTLKGMKLGDQPWLLQDSNMKTQIASQLPANDSGSLRSFAIGYDSYNIALHLGDLTSNNSEIVRGLSGDITIDQNGNIQRNISWITIE